jgi:hypothetical protein
MISMFFPEKKEDLLINIDHKKQYLLSRQSYTNQELEGDGCWFGPKNSQGVGSEVVTIVIF